LAVNGFTSGPLSARPGTTPALRMAQHSAAASPESSATLAEGNIAVPHCDSISAAAAKADAETASAHTRNTLLPSLLLCCAAPPAKARSTSDASTACRSGVRKAELNGASLPPSLLLELRLLELLLLELLLLEPLLPLPELLPPELPPPPTTALVLPPLLLGPDG
jgi:hypothetical protein